MKIIKLIFSISTVILILFIILNSFLNGNKSNELFIKLLHFFNIYIIEYKNILFYRKLIGHFLGYFVLGISLLLFFKEKQIIYFIIGLFLSIFTEIIQYFIPNRYFNLNDIFINIIGYILPIFIYNILFYKELFIYEMGNNVG